MGPVRNQFYADPVMVQCRADQPRLPVRHRRHGVEQVGHLARAAAERLAGGVVIRIRMRQRQAHLTRQLADHIQRTGQFGRDLTQPDQPLRLFLQAAEQRGVRFLQIRPVLRAPAALRQKRPFQVDACQRRIPAPGLVACCRFHDRAQFLFGQRYCRRTDGADPVLRLITRHSSKRRMRALA